MEVPQQTTAPSWRAEALHLFALSGFAFAQPLFDVLRSNTTFFVAHGTDAKGLIAFALGLVLLPAGIAVGVIALVRLVSARVAGALHLIAVGGLTALIAAPLARRPGLGTLTSAAACVLIGAIAVVAYARVSGVRRFASILAFAPIAFLALFFLTPSVRDLVAGAPALDRAAPRQHGEHPVVMLVMDEFSQGSLLQPDGTIDAERVPNFARLARRATWYPNATTNANATQNALPTTLTGAFPKTGPTHPPVHATHPDNAFSLLQASHDLHVDEWVTSLCTRAVCPQRPNTYSGPKHLASDTALVYLHVVLPQRMRDTLPPLGHQWAGFFANPADTNERLLRIPARVRSVARLILGWLDDDRLRSYQNTRFRAFLDTIEPSDPPRFSFLHIGLPHQPWHLLPGGEPYDPQHTPGLDRTNLRWASARFANAGLQRYMLQVKAMDRLVGEMIDRLDEVNLWDDTLVIVLADHGLTFATGHTVRDVRGREGDVLPIPLFVKYPQQRRAAVDRRNAEIVDVVPTIADVLGIDVRWRVDGSSLDGPDPERPLKRVWVAGRALTYHIDVARTKTHISDRIRDLFGAGSRSPDDVFAFGPHRRLIGRHLKGLPLENGRRIAVDLDGASRWQDYDPRGPFVPARPTGRISGTTRVEWLLVAVNDTIAGMGQPWFDGTTGRFEVMVSDRYLTRGRNTLTFVAIDEDGRLVRTIDR